MKNCSKILFLLVSVCIFQFSLYAVDVNFVDSNLEQAIRDVFNSNGWTLSSPPQDSELSRSDFTALDASNKGITDLTGIEYCTSLQQLNLGNNQITDLTPLGSLTNLVWLDIGKGKDLLSGIEFDELMQPGNNFTTLDPLDTLLNLQYLNVMSVFTLNDISAIQNMTQLQQLWMFGNPINSAGGSGIAPVEYVKNSLVIFLIGFSGLTNSDMSTINQLTNIMVLVIVGEEDLTDISSLTDINPVILSLSLVGVENLNVIANYPNLNEISIGQLPGLTTIPDMSELSNLQKIEFNECENLEDISGLNNVTSAKNVILNHNKIKDITSLSTLINIEYLELIHNQIEDIQALIDNPGLGGDDRVHINDNPLSQDAACNQLPALKAKFNNPGNVVSNAICGVSKTLTIEVVGTGTTNPSPGTYPIQEGQTFWVIALPLAGSGYSFSHWEGDISYTEEQGINVVMNSDKLVRAVFVQQVDYTVTISKQGPGNGDVSPGIGEFGVLSGHSFYLNAWPYGENYWGGWTGDINASTPSYYIQSVEQNYNIIANFSNTGYLLEINIVGNGYVDLQNIRLASGMEVELNAYSVWGYVFSHWEGDIGDADPNNPTITVVMDQNRTITAVFTEATRTLTVIIEGEGQTNPQGSAEGIQYHYHDNTYVYLEAFYGTNGWAFSHWSGDIGDIDAGTYRFSILMDRDRTIIAHFVPAERSLTISLVGNGATWPVPGTYGFSQGAEVEFGAFPVNNGDAFSHWEGNLPEGEDPIEQFHRVIMDVDREVTAIFVQEGYELVMNHPVGGGSYFYLDPPAGGVYRFLPGRLATIEVRLTEGNFWGGWKDTNTNEVISYDMWYRLLMDGNKNITPVITTTGYYLTINVNGPGSTFPGGKLGYTTNATPKIEARDSIINGRFLNWSGDLPDGVDPNTRDIEVLMDRDRTITANFQVLPRLLRIIVYPPGAGVTNPPAGDYYFLDNEPFEVQAIPNAGYMFRIWWGTNVPEEADPSSPTISGIMSVDRELVANFVPEFVSVPDLTGKTVNEANNLLAFIGLNIGAITYDYSNTIQEDLIMGQYPESDEQVPYGSSVDIVVSLGPCYTQVPDILGKTLEEAEVSLNQQKLIIGEVTYQYSYEEPPGVIISQNPSPQATVGCYTGVNVIVRIRPCETQVPDLIGKTLEEAQGILNTSQLALGTVGYEYSETVPQGRIISQGKEPNTIVECNTQIDIIVSSGPCITVVPNLVGKTLSEAQDILSTVQLSLGEISYDYNNEVTKDKIAIQGIEPETEVPCFTSIDVVISLGPCVTNVPDLIGKTFTEAQMLLSERQLGIGTISYENSDTVPEGQIISQNIEPETEVSCNSTIDIVISQGKASHSADQDGNGEIGLTELLRVIQFFNFGEYHCETGTEDNYAPGPGDQTCARHASDYNEPYWVIDLTELLRLIQFFNMGGYYPCEGGEDGYCPGTPEQSK